MIRFKHLPKHLIHVDAVPWDVFNTQHTEENAAVRALYESLAVKSALMVGTVLRSGSPDVEDGETVLIKAFDLRGDGEVNDYMQPINGTKNLMDRGEYLAFTHACLAFVETVGNDPDIPHEAAPLPVDP